MPPSLHLTFFILTLLLYIFNAHLPSSFKKNQIKLHITVYYDCDRDMYLPVIPTNTITDKVINGMNIIFQSSFEVIFYKTH